MPLSINGYTVVESSGEATFPQEVMQPPYLVDLRAVARMLPPTVSMTPAHLSF